MNTRLSGIYSLYMEPDAVTLRSSCSLPDREEELWWCCDTLEQEPHCNSSCRFNNAFEQGCVAPQQPFTMFTQQYDVTAVDGDSMLFHQSDGGIVQPELTFFSGIKKKKTSSSIIIHVWALWVFDEGSNLQEESWTLRHEDESDKCCQSGKQAYEYKQPPAVHLKLWADGKTPAWKIRQNAECVLNNLKCKDWK